jgi:phage head maturation protease
VSTALQPVQVGDETLYRLISVRKAVEPVQVETLGTRTPSPSGAPMALVYGRFMNAGEWNEIHAPAEAQFMGLRGSRFLELVAPGAFDRAIATAESGTETPPRLLFQHGQDNVQGTIPIGKITRLTPSGHYEALLFDTAAVRDLIPALRAGQYGSSYAPRGPIRGELRKNPPKSAHNPGGIPEWRLREVSQLKEISVVTWPADQKATGRLKEVRTPALTAA